jgi:hypothetical protein
MDDTILERIERIYAAIGAIEECDPQKLKARLIRGDKVMGFVQDFREGLSDHDLSNQAYTLIHNIANLADHLRKWASEHSQDKTKVDKTLDSSVELQIIKDLSNNDKHGYPPRDGGRSGKRPQLKGIDRVMRLQTQARAGSMIAMTIGRDGVPIFLGDGAAKAIVTGDIVDGGKNRIGDLYEIANIAVGRWEKLLAEFGLPCTNDAR